MKIHEIFLSVSGECGEFRQGSWVVFVRLAGCNLRCKWCDTERAQTPESGKEMTPMEVVGEVSRLGGYGTRQVIITGGEPLMQVESWFELLPLLRANLFVVQVETNGSIFPPLDGGPVTWVVDYKLPSSGMNHHMMAEENFRDLPSGSWIKFVIADKYDYEEATEVISMLGDNPDLNLAFSACPPGMSHAELFQRMKADGLTHVLLSCQIHKLANLKES